MTSWTSDELTRIGGAEDLQIASRRPDGTLRPYVTIWTVRAGDDLHVRSAYGKDNGWFRRAQASGTGRVRAGGVERDVAFGEAERAHLFDLARTANATPSTRRKTVAQRRIRPTVLRILDGMACTPAWIHNGRLDFLAGNPLGQALYAPMMSTAAQPVNNTRFTFLDPRSRDFYATGAAWPATSWRSCAPKPAATRTTRTSPTSSVSCPPAATTSVPAEPPTTCGSTTAAANDCTTPSSAASTCSTRPWTLRPTGD